LEDASTWPGIRVGLSFGVKAGRGERLAAVGYLVSEMGEIALRGASDAMLAVARGPHKARRLARGRPGGAHGVS